VVAGGGAVEVTQHLAPSHRAAPNALRSYPPAAPAAATPAAPKLQRRSPEPILTAPPLEAPADPAEAVAAPIDATDSVSDADGATGGAGTLAGADGAAGTGGALAPPEVEESVDAAGPLTATPDVPAAGNVEPMTSSTTASPSDVASVQGPDQTDQANQASASPATPSSGSGPAPGSGTH